MHCAVCSFPITAFLVLWLIYSSPNSADFCSTHYFVQPYVNSYMNWCITGVFDSFIVTFLYIPPAKFNYGINLQTTERKQIVQYIAGKVSPTLI